MPTPQIQNDPIYSLPHLYISGLNISQASITMLAIAPGQARDSNDVIDMPVGFPDASNNVNPPILFQNYQQPLFINALVNGVNGLDSGALVASSSYGVYLIGDSRGYNQVAGLMSLTSNAYPLIPQGYDSYRLLGFADTNASAQFDFSANFPQNMVDTLGYFLSPPVSVLSGGNAIVFTSVNCGAPVPTGSLFNVILDLLVTFIPSAANDVVQFRPTSSTATTGLTTITGQVAGVAQTQYIQIIGGQSATDPAFDYLVTNASDSVSVSVAGFYATPYTSIP